jgi:hypothetical protein
MNHRRASVYIVSLALSLGCGGASEPEPGPAPNECAAERGPDSELCCESRALLAELASAQCFESQADVQAWLQLRQLSLQTRECWGCGADNDASD